ncbi:hypothetical protein EYV94_05130 [Puteibacter caeruleilacunae]|nr:hypothetical protein EYV94_05130 [Puteibacter caeruleilacunae]
MKISRIIYNKVFVLLIGAVAWCACSDLDETHEEFITNGEDIYVGKPIEVFTNPGNNRIKFNVVISADPKISKGEIIWGAGVEKYEFDVSRTKEGIDTLTYELNIDEGSYAFEITLMDNHGHSSMTYEHTGHIYGDKYAGALYNRRITSISLVEGDAVIVWAAAEEGVVKTIVTYEDSADQLQAIEVLAEETETTITDFKSGGAISIVTVSKPTEDALDSFESKPESHSFPEVVEE